MTYQQNNRVMSLPRPLIQQPQHTLNLTYDCPDRVDQLTTDFVELTGQFTEPLGNGIQGARVVITSDNFGSAATYTSVTGHFGGHVPANENLTLSVYVSCGDPSIAQLVHSEDLGSLTSDTYLPISSDWPSITLITGTVIECNSTPVVNGYVMADNEVYFCTNGDFSFATLCGDSLTLVGHNPASSSVSDPLTILLQGGIQVVDTLETCNELVWGSVVDIDGNTYPTVIIGAQEWMAENLRTTHYQDGSLIPNLTNDDEWVISTTSGVWCSIDHDPSYDLVYGKLYNWYTAVDPRNVCPLGWHIPSEVEFEILFDNFPPLQEGGPLKTTGTIEDGTGLWHAPNQSATNQSGFSAVPAGGHDYNVTTDSWFVIGYAAYWWSATESDPNMGFQIRLSYGSSSSSGSPIYKHVGNSLRCVRD